MIRTRSAERLDEIANRLDAIAAEEDRLYRERGRLWKAELERGATPTELGEVSRVQPGTVRQVLARARR